MPYQLRMQSVTKKSGTFVQVAGVEGVISAGALVGNAASAAIAASATSAKPAAANVAATIFPFIAVPEHSQNIRASSRGSICTVVILQGCCAKAQGRRDAKRVREYSKFCSFVEYSTSEFP